MQLAQVEDAFEEAEAQVVAYRTALERSQGETLRLRTYAVVALGCERLLVRAGTPEG